MHIELARRLTGPEGAEAVAAAEALPDPDPWRPPRPCAP
ncbi:hypothetical protein HMPREF0682_0052, partial [Propionibacterium acidifaciens F0233]